MTHTASSRGNSAPIRRNRGRSKPVRYGDLADGKLFVILAEKRDYYEHCEKKHGFLNSSDHTVYRKVGNSHATARDGRAVILALGDLIIPFNQD